MADMADTTGRASVPLHLAVRRGLVGVVRLLLRKNVDPNLREDGYTPCHFAAFVGNPEILDVLVQAGGDLSLADGSGGYTALHIAAQEGREAVVSRILEQPGADALVAAVTGAGDTPLHFAACNGHLGCVRLLLAHGASVVAEDEEGKTPLAIASTPAVVAALQEGSPAGDGGSTQSHNEHEPEAPRRGHSGQSSQATSPLRTLFRNSTGDLDTAELDALLRDHEGPPSPPRPAESAAGPARHSLAARVERLEAQVAELQQARATDASLLAGPSLERDVPLEAVLSQHGLAQYRDTFVREGAETLGDLHLYTETELRALGVLGAHAKRLVAAARAAAPSVKPFGAS